MNKESLNSEQMLELHINKIAAKVFGKREICREKVVVEHRPQNIFTFKYPFGRKPIRGYWYDVGYHSKAMYQAVFMLKSTGEYWFFHMPYTTEESAVSKGVLPGKLMLPVRSNFLEGLPVKTFINDDDV